MDGNIFLNKIIVIHPNNEYSIPLVRRSSGSVTTSAPRWRPSTRSTAWATSPRSWAAAGPTATPRPSPSSRRSPRRTRLATTGYVYIFIVFLRNVHNNKNNGYILHLTIKILYKRNTSKQTRWRDVARTSGELQMPLFLYCSVGEFSASGTSVL